MNDFDTYLCQVPLKYHEILEFVHNYMSSIPNIQCTIKWNVPFYSMKKDICYMQVHKKEKQVELVFKNNPALDNTHGRLHARGRKHFVGILVPELAEEVLADLFFTIDEVIQNAIDPDYRFYDRTDRL